MSEVTEPTGADTGHADAPAQPRDGDPAAPKVGISNGNGTAKPPSDGSDVWAKAKAQTQRDLLKKLGISSLDEAAALIQRARGATAAPADAETPEEPDDAPSAQPSAKLERALRQRDRDIAERDREIAKANAKADALFAAMSARDAADKAAKRDKILEDAARAAKAHSPAAVAVLLRDRVTIDDDGEPVVTNTEGTPTTLTVEELIGQWGKTNTWAIQSTAPPGAGSPGAPQVGAASSGPVSIKNIDVNDPQALAKFVKDRMGSARK